MRRKLGSVEYAFTASGRFAPLAAVSILHLHPGPVPEKIHQAITTLQRHHPLLRATLLTKGSSYFFEIGSDAPRIPVEVIPRRDDDHWKDVATAELNREIGQDGTPLMRLTYLRPSDENGPVDLIFSFHHSIIDATSGAHLQEQLLALCAGSDDSFQEVRFLQPPSEERFPRLYRGIRAFPHTLAFLARQMADEMRYRMQLKNARRQPIYPTAVCAILTRKLDAATTAQLTRQARRQRITLNSLTSAAMLSAVHQHLYNGQPMPLRAIMFGSLRPYLEPPVSAEDLGCMITMLRYTVMMKQGMDLWQLAAVLQDKNAEAFQRGEKFLAAVFTKRVIQMTIGLKAFRLAATAVSYAGPLDLQQQYGPYKVTAMHNFVSNNRLGPEYVAAAHILFGELIWNFLYLDTDMPPETADAIADT
ncbi:MAG: condensation domain-containing protein, partial [Candidatus Promineifilaceae bacterium]